MNPNPKKVASRSSEKKMARRVADRVAVTVHPSEEARKKYLSDHKGADPSKHVVEQDAGSEGGESKMRRKPTQRKELGKKRLNRERAKEEYRERRRTKSKSKAEGTYRRQKGRPSKSERGTERKERFAPKERFQRKAKEFPTQEAKDKYIDGLKQENQADAAKRHTVKKNDSGSTNSDTGNGSSSIKMPAGTKPSPSIAKELETKAGQEAVATITTKEKAKAFAKKIAEAAKPKNIIKMLADSTVREVRNVVQNTPTILMDCIKEGRKPSSEKQKWPKGCDEPGSKTKCSVGEASERDVLYGSAVYAGGVAVATALSGGGSALAVGVVGAKAFLNSLTLHIGIGAVSSQMDTGLLHAEVGQDAATLAGGSMAEAVSNFGTGTIDGLGTLFEAAVNVGKTMLATEDFDSILQDQELIRVANEGDAGKTYEKFVQRVVDYAVAKLEKGLTDEEVKSILEYEA